MNRVRTHGLCLVSLKHIYCKSRFLEVLSGSLVYPRLRTPTTIYCGSRLNALFKDSYVVYYESFVISVNVAQVSGTERQHVASDYALRLATGASEVM